MVQECGPEDAGGAGADDEVAVGDEVTVADEVAVGDAEVWLGFGEGEADADGDLVGDAVVGDGAAEVCGADGEVAAADGVADVCECDGDGRATGPFRGPQAMTPHPVRTASAALRRVLPIANLPSVGELRLQSPP